MTKPTLLLVEDDRALADLLLWHFEREGYEVIRTADGDEALLLAEERPPDLVILDWMIEGVSGIEVCRRLRRRASSAHVPIIMLTARGEESDRIRGLETGADDYVTKPFSPRELVARVNVILRRTTVRALDAKATASLSQGGLSVDPEQHVAAFAGTPLRLTAIEFGILRAFLTRPTVVFSREQIMSAAYQLNIQVSDRTIDSHIRNIRAKLSAVNCDNVIETIHGVGFKLGRCEPQA